MAKSRKALRSMAAILDNISLGDYLRHSHNPFKENVSLVSYRNNSATVYLRFFSIVSWLVVYYNCFYSKLLLSMRNLRRDGLTMSGHCNLEITQTKPILRHSGTTTKQVIHPDDPRDRLLEFRSKKLSMR